MLIATIIPNTHPAFLRRKLMDASTLALSNDRREAVDKVTSEIQIAHPELFWSEEELAVMQRAWDAARISRENKERRDKELSALLAKSTGGVARLQTLHDMSAS
jgi:hypothetical protein